MVKHNYKLLHFKIKVTLLAIDGETIDIRAVLSVERNGK